MSRSLAGDSVQIRFTPQTDMFPDSLHVILHYNPDVFSYRDAVYPAHWSVVSREDRGTLDLLFTNGVDFDTLYDSRTKKYDGSPLSVTFNSYLSTPSSTIAIERAQLLSRQFDAECLGYHAAPGSRRRPFVALAESTAKRVEA